MSDDEDCKQILADSERQVREMNAKYRAEQIRYECDIALITAQAMIDAFKVMDRSMREAMKPSAKRITVAM